MPFGPYVNRNHFAGFAELVLPLALVPLVLGRVRRERWPIVGLLAVLPIGALFLSASRGGLVSFGAELGVLALVMIQRRETGKQLLPGVAVVLAALLLVSWLGVGQILQRLVIRTITRSDCRKARLHAEGHLADLSGPPSRGNWTWHAANRLSALRNPLRWKDRQSHTQRLSGGSCRKRALPVGLCCAAFIGVLLAKSLKRFAPTQQFFCRGVATLRFGGLQRLSRA